MGHEGMTLTLTGLVRDGIRTNAVHPPLVLLPGLVLRLPSSLVLRQGYAHRRGAHVELRSGARHKQGQLARLNSRSGCSRLGEDYVRPQGKGCS